MKAYVDNTEFSIQTCLAHFYREKLSHFVAYSWRFVVINQLKWANKLIPLESSAGKTLLRNDYIYIQKLNYCLICTQAIK